MIKRKVRIAEAPEGSYTYEFTPEEVADYLQVTRRTVYEWMRHGKLRGVKVGSRWRFTEDHLQEFLRYEGGFDVAKWVTHFEDREAAA